MAGTGQKTTLNVVDILSRTNKNVVDSFVFALFFGFQSIYKLRDDDSNADSYVG